MKFNFRLQGLLGVKEKIEDQKKLAYGQALTELEKEKERKIMLLKEKDETIAEFKRSIQEKINPNELGLFNDYIEIVKKRIIEQEKVIERAAVKAEQKRLELVEAVKERKMLETLKERLYDEYLIEEKIAEQKQVDQLVSYQYNKR